MARCPLRAVIEDWRIVEASKQAEDFELLAQDGRVFRAPNDDSYRASITRFLR